MLAFSVFLLMLHYLHTLLGNVTQNFEVRKLANSNWLKRSSTTRYCALTAGKKNFPNSDNFLFIIETRSIAMFSRQLFHSGCLALHFLVSMVTIFNLKTKSCKDWLHFVLKFDLLKVFLGLTGDQKQTLTYFRMCLGKAVHVLQLKPT